MSCGFQSEWLDKLIKSSATPIEILARQWEASNHSDGILTSTPVIKQKYSDGKLQLTAARAFK